MRIVEEDMVDWEPLRMRFIPREAFSPEEATALADFIVQWCRQRESEAPEDWRFAEYSATPHEDGAVHAFCELMPKDALQPLADAVAAAFPTVDHMRIGDPLTSPASCIEFDWFEVPKGRVNISGEDFDVEPFTISFTAITVGQFTEFMTAASYIPVPDRIEYEGYTIGNFQLDFGKSPKIPLFGLTYDDAEAFCSWAGFRLPSDAELRLFFETAVLRKRKFEWSGECWTSTPSGPDMFFVRNGPYRRTRAQASDPHRTSLHRHHYEHLEAPCFRVVKVSA